VDPHPDFADSALPQNASVGAFRLTPLGVADVDEDYEAVMSSARVLKGLFGDEWPIGLTRANNLVGMGWHEREFSARRSFAWIIRDADGAYLGCAYLYPDIGTRNAGTVVTWIRARADRLSLLTAFNGAFAGWLRPYLPEGYLETWVSNDQQV